mmetsp:Transcript_12300/g.40916  ORF Transcript_12300/g.40916 Transcript_12300/m.40916 type:complete len:214 (+) Transcript_12300:2924-3565(+)
MRFTRASNSAPLPVFRSWNPGLKTRCFTSQTTTSTNARTRCGGKTRGEPSRRSPSAPGNSCAARISGWSRSACSPCLRIWGFWGCGSNGCLTLPGWTASSGRRPRTRTTPCAVPAATTRTPRGLGTKRMRLAGAGSPPPRLKCGAGCSRARPRTGRSTLSPGPVVTRSPRRKTACTCNGRATRRADAEGPSTTRARDGHLWIAEVTKPADAKA